MVETGLEAYYAHSREYDLSEDIVRGVFLAMYQAAFRVPSRDPESP